MVNVIVYVFSSTLYLCVNSLLINHTSSLTDVFGQKAECKNFFSNITIKGDSAKKTIEARVESNKCFTPKGVILFLLWPEVFKKCDPLKGKINQSFQFQATENQDHQWEPIIHLVTFTNLKPGNYCLLIEAYSFFWPVNTVVSILEKPAVIKIQEDPPAISKRLISIAEILSVCTIFIIVIILTVMCWKYKCGKKNMPKILSENDEHLPFIEPLKTEVIIVDLHCKNIEDEITWLTDFMKNYAGFNVALMSEMIHIVLTDASNTLDVILHCCQRVGGTCVCNKRVIFILTESILQCIQCKKNMLSNLIRGVAGFSPASYIHDGDEDIGQILFHLALDKISTDTKFLGDMHHLFVICFDDTLPYRYNFDVNLVPNYRYIISKDSKDEIYNLCIDLNNTFSDPMYKERFCDYMVKHPLPK